ncbi:MAG: hypothetical protein WD078_05290 [Woeseia sp.]
MVELEAVHQKLILWASACETQENQYCAIQAHDILVIEAADLLAKPAFRDCSETGLSAAASKQSIQLRAHL